MIGDCGDVTWVTWGGGGRMEKVSGNTLRQKGGENLHESLRVNLSENLKIHNFELDV
jgi:hypothetical protein